MTKVNEVEKGGELAESYSASEENSICSIPQMQELLADKLSHKVIIAETHVCLVNETRPSPVNSDVKRRRRIQMLNVIFILLQVVSRRICSPLEVLDIVEN